MKPFDFQKLHSRLPRTIKQGFVDDNRRGLTPHCIDIVYPYDGMMRQGFYADRRGLIIQFLHEICTSDYEIEPIRDLNQRLVGQRFRFADINEALWFKLRFG